MAQEYTTEFIMEMHSQAEKALEQIYRDYQNKADQFRADSEARYASMVPWNEAMRRRSQNLCLGVPGDNRTRIIFLAILSISETYMEILTTSNDDLWIPLVQLLRQHRASIEFFARSRGVVWLRAVTDLIPSINPGTEPRLLDLFSQEALADFPSINGIGDEILHQDLIDRGPDTFYLSREDTIIPILAPSFNAAQLQGIQVLDAKDCTYNRELFEQHSPPPGWPWRRWPRHPQLCEEAHIDDGKTKRIRCKLCNHRFSNNKDWNDPNLGCQCHDWCADALVQVVEYPPYPDQPNVVNRGVRALQAFEAGTIIGEYTGQLVPLGMSPDCAFYDHIYFFSLNSVENHDEIAGVAARLYGNWTRFINHSHDRSKQNIAFKPTLIANRSRITAQTIKRIKFGEEILGHYGPEYFTNG
jgi:hypothetical protein